jgi:hypothetical protein
MKKQLSERRTQLANQQAQLAADRLANEAQSDIDVLK